MLCLAKADSNAVARIIEPGHKANEDSTASVRSPDAAATEKSLQRQSLQENVKMIHADLIIIHSISSGCRMSQGDPSLRLISRECWKLHPNRIHLQRSIVDLLMWRR